LELTGLEEPEELWDRLQEATAQGQALSTANKKLAARVRVLERQLSEAGGLTDDELVAELPRRMSRALESAQGVAGEIVRRARKYEASLRHKAAEEAGVIVRQASNEATAIVNQARAEAAAHISAAQAQALDIIGGAENRRTHVVARMEDEVVQLQQRIRVLRKGQARLVHAYDIVERTLHEAGRALADSGDGPAPDRELEPSPERDREPRPAAAGPRRGRPKPAMGPVGVYDWSPAASNAG
jgi:cell division septum initiation protein DivIVA